MDKIEQAISFFQSIEEKDWSKLRQLLSDDFLYYGPMPDPFNKEEWLAFQMAVQTAFPDWSYNLKKVELNNDSVEIIVHITGTHLNELKLPMDDLKAVPASGIKIDMPEERATLKFKFEKISELKVHGTFHGGLPGLLTQLGLE